ncbi:hypothetical protein SDD30_02560 [Moorella naiadis]|uniref:hypothetical protein n=1 Tax=Moorella naiadis (nom. illeg.) TaxID=3093670 RepID=UPI003D9C8532
MTTAQTAPATCRIILQPRHAGASKTISYYLERARKRIPTNTRIELRDNELRLQGQGTDGRCACCRYLRKALATRGIPFIASCPLEVLEGTSRRVKVGNAFFNQELLEDEEKYLGYLRRVENDPYDLEAQLALGVIHEYHGRFAPAVACYWAARELDPSDAFIKDRLEEILTLLQKFLTPADRC